jgi:hypothetical protein
MFVLLPVFLLLFSSVLILILQRSRKGFGYAWLIALGSALLAWIVILWLHWKAPPPVAFSNWVPIKGADTLLSFQLDLITWPYAFCLVSIALAVILTDIARLRGISSVWEWAGSLAMTSTGLLAIMAGTPLTLALTWMVIDLIDLTFVLRSANTRKRTIQAFMSFSFRAAGTFFVLLGAIVSQSHGIALTLNNIPPVTRIYLFMAAGLRLGVFPIHPLYVADVNLRRGFGTILSMVSPASSLMLLGHLSQSPVPPRLTLVFEFLVVVVILYGAIVWFMSKDELSGRPYWLLSLAGIAMLCILRGHPASTMAWGVTLILSGGVIFLYSARTPGLLFIPLLASLELLGLPFSPSASGWNGLVEPFSLAVIFIFIALFLLFYGYYRFAMQPGDGFSSMERWAQPIYPLGLLVLISSQWVVGLWGFPGSLTVGVWWAGVVPIVITGAVLFWTRQPRNALAAGDNRIGLVYTLAIKFWNPLTEFFSLNWFYNLLGYLYNFFERLLYASTLVLEGDGGVLWALLFLAILITLTRVGVTP